MRKVFILVLIALFTFVFFKTVFADSLDDQIAQTVQKLNELKTDLQNKQTNFGNLQTKLADIKSKIVYLEAEVVKKEQEVHTGEQALEYQKTLLDARSLSYYKNISKSSLSLLDLFIADNISKSLENFFYQKSLVDTDKNTIIKIVLYIKDLEEKKASLEQEKTQLSQLKVDLDSQSAVLSAQIAQTQNQIAELTSQQEQLLAQKLASLNISRSAATLGRCDSDLTNGRDPGFSPKFAFFTYGVPNRVGLNQYGAKGRAEAGENNEENILRAYYNFDSIQQVSNVQIHVDGYDTYSLEDYLKGIHEMPTSFPPAALRAQAIAARSYAMAYTNNGSGSICATESCQVFSPAGDRNDAWTQAVKDTAGKAMVKGGNPIKAWFSSTHGGYVLASGDVPGWSGTDWTKHATDFSGSVGSFSDLQNNAYDKSSPWFYCDWGSRGNYNKTAWLKPDELADIVNTIMLAKCNSSAQPHLYQPDNPPPGTDTWNQDRVKQELRNCGGSPFNSVDNVSVSADFGWGKSTSVNVSGDGGSQSFDAPTFKNYFNLRAPANIQIVGPLFNAEKR